MELLFLVIFGYYTWGIDGFSPSTQAACQEAETRLKQCIAEGADDARGRAITEIEEALDNL